MEPKSGFEPETPSFPWKCSTTELRRHTSDNCSKSEVKNQVMRTVHSFTLGLKTRGLFDTLISVLRANAALAQLVRAAVL